jgi:hypothetical protein
MSFRESGHRCAAVVDDRGIWRPSERRFPANALLRLEYAQARTVRTRRGTYDQRLMTYAELRRHGCALPELRTACSRPTHFRRYPVAVAQNHLAKSRRLTAFLPRPNFRAMNFPFFEPMLFSEGDKFRLRIFEGDKWFGGVPSELPLDLRRSHQRVPAVRRP